MSVCMTPAGVKYLNVLLLQESSMSVLQVSSMSVCMTPAGVKNLNV